MRRRRPGRRADPRVPAGVTAGVRRSRDVPTLVARAREGDPRAVARLITPGRERRRGAARGRRGAGAVRGHGPRSIGLTGSPGVGKSTTTNELVRVAARGRAPGRGARRRPVQPVHRRRDPRRPGPDAGPHHRPGRLHPVDVQPRPARRPGRGHPAGGPGARGRRLRRGAGRDGRGRARPRWRSPRSPTPRWCCSRPGWVTRSRRSRPASWRSPTSSWSTRRTGPAPTPRTATSRACSRSANARPGTGGRRSCGPSRSRARASTTSSPPSTSTARWLVESGGLRRRRRGAGRRRGRGDRARHLRARLGSLRDGTALSTLAARVADGSLDPYAAADQLLTVLEL